MSVQEIPNEQAEILFDEKDKEKVEEFLTKLVNTATYIRAIDPANKELTERITLERFLDKKQIELLISPQYLNSSEKNTDYTNRPTTLDMIYMEYDPYSDSYILELSNNENQKNSVLESQEPFILGLRENVKSIKNSEKKYIEQLDNKIEVFYSQLTALNNERECAELLEKINTKSITELTTLTFWNKFIAGQEITPEYAKKILLEIYQLELTELELAKEGVRFVGTEIEMPNTGKLEYNEITPATFVALPGNLKLLKSLNLETEMDEQGEIAISKSRNPVVQYKILQELSTLGFIPKNSDLNFTCHLNISVSPNEFELLRGYRSQAYEKHPMTDAEEARLDLVGYIVGKRFASTARLLYGEYSNPVDAKGHYKSEGAYRFEVRTLELFPEQSETDFTFNINTIRKYSSLVIETMVDQKEQLETSTYADFIKEYAKIFSEGKAFETAEEAETFITKNKEQFKGDTTKDAELNALFDRFVGAN